MPIRPSRPRRSPGSGSPCRRRRGIVAVLVVTVVVCTVVLQFAPFASQRVNTERPGQTRRAVPGRAGRARGEHLSVLRHAAQRRGSGRLRRDDGRLRRRCRRSRRACGCNDHDLVARADIDGLQHVLVRRAVLHVDAAGAAALEVVRQRSSPVAPSQLDDGAAAVSVTPSATAGAALGLSVGAAVEIGATSGVSRLSAVTGAAVPFVAVSSMRMLAPTSAAVSLIAGAGLTGRLARRVAALPDVADGRASGCPSSFRDSCSACRRQPGRTRS